MARRTALSVQRRKVPGRSSPLWGWGHTGCESEAAFADSVLHTIFPYRLRQQPVALL